LKFLAFGLIIFGGLIYLAFGGADESPLSLLGIPFMFVGVLVHYRGRQYRAKARAEALESPLTDSRPDVLYLRSFQTDPSTTSRQLMGGFTTEEEELADVLKPFGDMVAIGQPGEHLPVPGAARMYASDAEWKDVVIERMRSAPLVVIRAGSSPGLFWEMGQALKNMNPECLLILILNIRVQDYNVFASQVRESFGLELPELQSAGLMRAVIDRRESPSKATPGFVTFSSDWSALFLPLPLTIVRLGYNDLRKPFNAALRPVFERHGIAWHDMGRLGA
jgi:hypothetical protein